MNVRQIQCDNDQKLAAKASKQTNASAATVDGGQSATTMTQHQSTFGNRTTEFDVKTRVVAFPGYLQLQIE